MDLKSLKEFLENARESLANDDKAFLQGRLTGLASVFPFNEYEYLLSFLLSREILSFDQYERLRERYVSDNKYLELYGLAPRVFGQIWGETHIRDLDSRFQKPDKILDPSFAGEYDLLIEGIKVEVKACRCIDTSKRSDLVSKALRTDSTEPFWMNFQQLKLDICDIFVFIGVWVNEIRYWVLSNVEVKENNYLSHQHRGGIEYQIGITHKNVTRFEQYLVAPSVIGDTIIRRAKAV